MARWTALITCNSCRCRQ